MTSILLVYDDDLLEKLYNINLSVYLAAKVTKLKALENLESTLKNNEYQMIVIILTNDIQNNFNYIKDVFTSNDFKGQQIFIGEKESEDDVRSYFSIQKTIRLAAKKLKITAKDMALKQVSKFYEIDIDLISGLKKAPVNIYKNINVDDASEYLLIAEKNDEIQKTYDSLLKENIRNIYVNAVDRLNMVNNISTSICEALTLTNLVKGVHRSEFIAMNMDFISRNISDNDVSNEIITIASSCSKIMNEVVEESPSLSHLLEVFQQNKNGFVYVHSMLCAYVASHVVKNVNCGGESHIEKINFVLFFHDIVLAPLFEKYPDFFNEEDLLFNGNLNEAEKNILINHARMSAEIVANLKKAPIGADLLIKQHHGMGNGVGFAVEFRDDISPLTKIIIISEAFVEEFLSLKNNNEKIEINLIIKKLNEKFTKHTYKKMLDPLLKLKF